MLDLICFVCPCFILELYMNLHPLQVTICDDIMNGNRVKILKSWDHNQCDHRINNAI